MKPILLTTEQAAQYLNLQPTTLCAWRCKGGGPEYIKLGKRSVRYTLNSLQDFVEKSTLAHTAASEVYNGE